MLGPYPTRLRSYSSPSRPRATANADVADVPSETSAQQPSSSSPAAHAVENPKRAHAKSSSAISPRPHGGKRKILRLKRPSSSSSAIQGSREFSSFPLEPPPPPRPPRNPARIKELGRTFAFASVADPTQFPIVPVATPSRSLEKRREDDPTSWIFPHPSGTDSPLQRKKSKSSKAASYHVDHASINSEVQFSTVDRTILHEMRQKIDAKDDYFIMRRGKRHHKFPPHEVPYPRNYDKQVVDHDVWSTMWVQQMTGDSITWHVFETPPQRVLDLGCGSGSWLLEAARMWKNTHFTGLDIVPLHPDLKQLGLSDMASRITWVHANFLEGLPFSDEEFDYVRVTRIARAVPEHKWDWLFEEISRVMKPGGAFELFEEDLYFPGRLSELPSRSRQPSRPSWLSSPQARSNSLSPPPERDHLSDISLLAFGRSASPEPLSSSRSSSRAPSTAPSRQDPSVTDSGWGEETVRPHEKSRLMYPFEIPINPHDHSLLEAIYNEMHAARFINLRPLSLLTSTLSLYFKDVRTHPPLNLMFPPPRNEGPRSGRASGPASTASSLDSQSDLESNESSRLSNDDTSHRNGPGRSSSVSACDHSSNWIHNLHLIENTCDYVKVDINRIDALSPMFRASISTPPIISPDAFSSNQSYFDLRPRGSPAHALPDPLNLAGASMNRLPNSTVNFDVRSLNMHLSLRIQEVLACAEAMWDFVIDYQKSRREGLASRGSPPIDRRQPRASSDVQPPSSISLAESGLDEALMAITRANFDHLLQRFEFDMHDCIGLNGIVEDRLGWSPFVTSRSEPRKEYDEKCAAWAQYHAQMHTPPHPAMRSSGTTLRGPQRSDERSLRSLDSHAHRSSEQQGVEVLSNYTGSVRGARDAQCLCPPLPPWHRLNRTTRAFVAWKA
ncbi:hypothetical protein OBBRIDRAFT_834627 [Obba rivulosa]|uniref:Methyltransferase domain-containing protein n=1 Tax=Obba rivulosa TaxID=1052685 RepID=A0A8E2AUN5_9APHY|nr:hypothetical protein OBBRIDRAFT_834627 [Obba rivulosa]